MGQSDWEWADKALRDNRCSAEFAREAATRCEALRKPSPLLSEPEYIAAGFPPNGVLGTARGGDQ